MSHSVFTRRAVLVSMCAGSAAMMCVAQAANEEPPFALHKRPMPQGEDLNVLLPAMLGPFKRDALAADAKLKSDEDLNVTYRAGNETVNVGLSRADTVDDARDAINVSREEAKASKVPLKGEKLSLKTDPAYFHVGDFIAWTRGRYFFYAKASSPATLTRFMAVYPF
jgi:hypothetical protein